MTQEEIKNGLCALQQRYSEILYKEKNQSTDGIPNLSDIKEQHPKNRANLWKSVNSYSAGDISLVGVTAYISIEDSTNEYPVNNPTKWKEIDQKGLETGDFFVSAYVCIETSNIYADEADLNVHISDSFNVSSLTNLGNGIYKVNLSGSTGINSNDYLVLHSGTPKKSGVSPYPIKYSSVIIFNKSETGFYIKYPFIAGIEYISLVIMTKQ